MSGLEFFSETRSILTFPFRNIANIRLPGIQIATLVEEGGI